MFRGGNFEINKIKFSKQIGNNPILELLPKTFLTILMIMRTLISCFT